MQRNMNKDEEKQSEGRLERRTSAEPHFKMFYTWRSLKLPTQVLELSIKII